MSSQPPSLSRRQELCAQGALEVETHNGEWITPGQSYVCPDLCGSVFATEEAYRDFCPADCGFKANTMAAKIDAATKEETFDVFCLYRQDGRCLKVTTDLTAVSALWWWRNVSAVAVHHFPSQSASQAATGRLRDILKPVYDIDPDAVDEPRPLSTRVPEPQSGPHEHVITFRVSDELEARIVAQSEAEGLSKGDWLRRVVELHS